MSNSFEHSTGHSSYRDARDDFSVEELWARVDEVLDDEQFNGFKIAHLEEWAELGLRELTYVDDDDIYGAEVFVSMKQGDMVYRVADNGTTRVVVHEDEEVNVMYGYVRDFTVGKAPGCANYSLLAKVGCYEDNGEIEMYIIPIISEGSSDIIHMTEVPTPVEESGVAMELNGVQNEAFETEEQGTIQSLLNLLENDVFDRHPISISQVNTTVASFLLEEFIEGLDDISTAVNYYLQRCAHDIDNEMWLVDLDTYVGESLQDGVNSEDGSGYTGVMKVMSGEYALEGVEFFLSEGEGVQSRMYVRSEEGEPFYMISRPDVEIGLYRQGCDGEDESED